MSQYPSSPDFDQPAAPAKGMAVSGLICSILGCCLPGLGIVGIILGVIALSRAKSDARRYGGGGAALAAIIVGAVSLVVSILFIIMIGIMLPAVGKARQAARQLKSGTQLLHISSALHRYANDNKGWFPEAGADWQSRLQPYAVPPGDFVSPYAPNAAAADSYIYIPGYKESDADQGQGVVLIYDNPVYIDRGSVNIVFVGGMKITVPASGLQTFLDASPKAGAVPAAPPPRPPAVPPRPRRPGG